MKKALLALALVLILLPTASAHASTYRASKHVTAYQKARRLEEKKYAGSELMGAICLTNAKFTAQCK